MTESDALAALDQAGIRYGEKIDPTGKGGYFQIHVPLEQEIDALSGIEYAITGSNQHSGSRRYLVITLDNRNVVTKVE